MDHRGIYSQLQRLAGSNFQSVCLVVHLWHLGSFLVVHELGSVHQELEEDRSHHCQRGLVRNGLWDLWNGLVRQWVFYSSGVEWEQLDLYE